MEIRDLLMYFFQWGLIIKGFLKQITVMQCQEVKGVTVVRVVPLVGLSCALPECLC